MHNSLKISQIIFLQISQSHLTLQRLKIKNWKSFSRWTILPRRPPLLPRPRLPYNIQDKDIIDTTSMALVDLENYNRKTSFTNHKAVWKHQDFTEGSWAFPDPLLRQEHDRDTLQGQHHSPDLQLREAWHGAQYCFPDMILGWAISLTKKKKRVKVPAGPLKGLSRVDVKRRPSFLLTISQVLFHRSKSFQQIEDKNVAKMNMNNDLRLWLTSSLRLLDNTI